MGMATGVGTEGGGQTGRLEGALKLLNVLIGIRLRSVADPESRRHLVWLNDIVAALGLWNRRTVRGGAFDVSDYLDGAVAFWGRVSPRCRVTLERPAEPVLIPDITAAGLSIIAHELIGVAIARLRPEEGDCRVVLSLEADQEGLRLSITDQGPSREPGLSAESLDLIRGLAEHLGGRLFLPRPAARAITVVLPAQDGFDVRH